MSSLINKYGTNFSGDLFTNNIVPKGGHTLPAPGSNVQSAAGIYPCASQKGGKKINKIYRKYKMMHSKRRHNRRTKKMRSQMRRQKHSRHNRYNKTRNMRMRMRMGMSRRMRMGMGMNGGGFQPPMTAPNYPAGHNQFNNNDGSLSNTYSRGGVLPPSLSAMAMPAPYQKLAGDPDNLNHNTLNSFNNIGAGSGFASRGWF